MNPDTRYRALQLASARACHGDSLETVLKEARKIEAYLDGRDTDPNANSASTYVGGGGGQGASPIIPVVQPKPVKKADWS